MEEHNTSEPPLELLIEARPEILVGLNKEGTVDIIVNSINEINDSVNRDSVRIPLECCEEIGNALLALAHKHLSR